MIEVGEKEDTNILNTSKKKTYTTRKIATPKNPKATTPNNTTTLRKLLMMLIEGEGEDINEVFRSNFIHWVDSDVDPLIALHGEMKAELMKYENGIKTR